MTDCCGAFSTFMDETLCCKKCYCEVPFGQGDGSEYKNKEKPVRNTVRGELVRIGKSVYVRDDYMREYKLYMLTRWDDTSRSRLVKGSKLVEVDFTF